MLVKTLSGNPTDTKKAFRVTNVIHSFEIWQKCIRQTILKCRMSYVVKRAFYKNAFISPKTVNLHNYFKCLLELQEQILSLHVDDYTLHLHIF